MKRLLSSALITIAILILAACSAGSSGRAAAAVDRSERADDRAKDLEFSTATLSAPADEPFQIAFDNQESAPHNVAIYRDSSATEKVFGADRSADRPWCLRGARRWRRHVLLPLRRASGHVRPAHRRLTRPDDIGAGDGHDWYRRHRLPTRTRGWGSRPEPHLPT